jgi:leucyl-tRNA synthetase
MRGFNVLHPMGWDAFGQPAENEAIKLKRNPRPMVEEFAINYRRQLEIIGLAYDWDREINSSHASYYRWTQWCFLHFYKNGLAYRAQAPVNWCPVDKTVLANEEVVNGRCWRCETEVVKRNMPQWFFRITAYAERLLSDLETIDWPEGVSAMQRNWIGKSHGAEIRFEVEESDRRITVYTTRPDTVWGATFIILAPEHPLVDELTTAEKKPEVDAYVQRSSRKSEIDRAAEGKDKTGIWIGAYARNPVNGEKIPIWTADYVMMGYGTGAIMAVPAHDERDFEFATKFHLPITSVYRTEDEDVEAPLNAATTGGVAVIGPFVGLPNTEERVSDAISWLEKNAFGKGTIKYKLRDWLISRQRYWGAPIPIIHCPTCGEVPVPETDLPVILPDVENYLPSASGESPLATILEFVATTCPGCGGAARRETDTMGGFACSSWYFLRFADPRNSNEAWSREAIDYWLPVDMYVGGTEHAVMHLLYARFWTKVFFDTGLVGFEEPFHALRNQGNVLAFTPGLLFKNSEQPGDDDGSIADWKPLRPEELANHPAEQIEHRWSKMSKSKGNIVTPDAIAGTYGADTLRVYEMFVAPFEEDIQWKEEGIRGSFRFLTRVWRLVVLHAEGYQQNPWRERIASVTGRELALRRKTHQTIAKIGNDLEAFRFNIAIASIMEWINLAYEVSNALQPDQRSAAVDEVIENVILVLAPFAPHLSDELWETIGHTGYLYRHSWPEADAEIAKEEQLIFPVQVNGKLRDQISAAVDADEATLQAMALASPKIVEWMRGAAPKRVIVVPGKLVNIVV